MVARMAAPFASEWYLVYADPVFPYNVAHAALALLWPLSSSSRPRMNSPAPAVVAGIDLGTSSCKVGLFDVAGHPLGLGQSAFSIERGPGGMAELDPAKWWPAVCQAVRQALAHRGLPGEAVAALGLSGQVGTHLLLDRHYQPVGPAIGWQDTRAHTDARALLTRVGRERLAALLGIDLPPGAAWPLPRLLWLQRTASQRLAQAWRLLQVKDYVVYHLTGTLATDASSWRGLVQLPGPELAADLLRELGLPDDLLAPRYPPTSVIGTVTRAAAEASGLAAGTPVVVGWNDLNCGLLGTGIVAPGQGFDIGGTSEHLGLALPLAAAVASTDGLMLAPYLSENSAGAARVCYGVTSAGGGSLDWYANEFVPDLLAAYGLPLPAGAAARLEALAAEAPPGAGGLVYLPYLYGERAPIWDAAARGLFFGLDGTQRHRHLIRAVLEGVAFSLRQVLEVVEAATGTRVEAIHVSGGPARLRLWNEIKASVLNRPLVVPAVTQAACLGAALLATVGAGWFASADQAAAAMVRTAEQIDPNPQHTARYQDMFGLYASLYPQLRAAFAQLAALTAPEGTRP
jgi:xylulokinase